VRARSRGSRWSRPRGVSAIDTDLPDRSACVQSRPHRRAHGSVSHRQHQAGCPPTVQRGSGSSPRWRQSSTRSRWTPSRSPISASPTGSCFVCWSAMERRRLLPLGRRCLGRRRRRLFDTRSVGRESVLGYPAAERAPTRRPRVTRDGPPEGGTTRRAAKRKVAPWDVLGKSGDLPPARFGVATRTTSRQTGPTSEPKGALLGRPGGSRNHPDPVVP